jgi:hypothetical protein
LEGLERAAAFFVLGSRWRLTVADAMKHNRHPMVP